MIKPEPMYKSTEFSYNSTNCTVFVIKNTHTYHKCSHKNNKEYDCQTYSLPQFTVIYF